MAAVSIVESSQFTTVDVEHGQYGGIIIRRKNGDDNLGTREAAAGDMARELLDIRDDKRTALLPGRPTDTTPEGNVHTLAITATASVSPAISDLTCSVSRRYFSSFVMFIAQ